MVILTGPFTHLTYDENTVIAHMRDQDHDTEHCSLCGSQRREMATVDGHQHHTQWVWCSIEECSECSPVTLVIEPKANATTRKAVPVREEPDGRDHYALAFTQMRRA